MRISVRGIAAAIALAIAGISGFSASADDKIWTEKWSEDDLDAVREQWPINARLYKETGDIFLFDPYSYEWLWYVFVVETGYDEDRRIDDDPLFWSDANAVFLKHSTIGCTDCRSVEEYRSKLQEISDELKKQIFYLSGDQLPPGYSRSDLLPRGLLIDYAELLNRYAGAEKERFNRSFKLWVTGNYERFKIAESEAVKFRYGEEEWWPVINRNAVLFFDEAFKEDRKLEFTATIDWLADKGISSRSEIDMRSPRVDELFERALRWGLSEKSIRSSCGNSSDVETIETVELFDLNTPAYHLLIEYNQLRQAGFLHARAQTDLSSPIIERFKSATPLLPGSREARLKRQRNSYVSNSINLPRWAECTHTPVGRSCVLSDHFYRNEVQDNLPIRHFTMWLDENSVPGKTGPNPFRRNDITSVLGPQCVADNDTGPLFSGLFAGPRSWPEVSDGSIVEKVRGFELTYDADGSLDRMVTLERRGRFALGDITSIMNDDGFFAWPEGQRSRTNLSHFETRYQNNMIEMDVEVEYDDSVFAYTGRRSLGEFLEFTAEGLGVRNLGFDDEARYFFRYRIVNNIPQGPIEIMKEANEGVRSKIAEGYFDQGVLKGGAETRLCRIRRLCI